MISSTQIKRTTILSWLAIFVSLCGLILTLSIRNIERPGDREVTKIDSLARLKASRVIQAGWVPYAPYTSMDPVAGRPVGFYVDIFERMASEAGFKVQWIETTWATMIPDLKAQKFSVMASPIFKTIPRAQEVAFTRTIDRFGLSAIIAKDAPVIKNPLELNDPKFTVTVTQGEIGHEFAIRHLPKAKLQVLKSGDISLALVNVIEGRADAGICDSWTAAQFTEKHETRVRDLFHDQPFALVGASWFVKQGDHELCNFLNVAIEWLQINGEIEMMASKYQLPSIVESSK
jgi:ABC-type amino acid transport substrate-binding protein